VPASIEVPGGYYTGTIGTARVFLFTERGGRDGFDGTYAYGRIPGIQPEEQIEIHARIGADGRMEAYEEAWVNPQEIKRTGSFVGQVSDDGAHMKGEWSNGEKKVPFELALLARRKIVDAHGVDAGAASLEFVDAADKVGAALDREIRARVEALVRRAESQHVHIVGFVELTFHSRALASALWRWNGPGVERGREGIVVAARDGRASAVALPDLFRDGTEWKRRVDDACIAAIRERDPMEVARYSPVRIAAFVVEGKAALRFFLEPTPARRPGQVYEVAVPLSRLGDAIDRAGPLASLLDSIRPAER
jgi:hypothetical protein